MCRLGHKKSRKGCIACKRRRVKCDEQAPCRNCVRRGEQCSLLAPSPSASSEKGGALPCTTEEWMEDLRLMRHFMATTRLASFGTRTLTKTEEGHADSNHDIERLWQDMVAEEATKYPFLMHGLLALSALHVAQVWPNQAEKNLRMCDSHQNKALEMFRSVLSSELNAEMATPMFLLASTISMSSMAKACATAGAMPEPRHVNMDQVAELFLLTRGVRDVVGVCSEWIQHGPLKALLGNYHAPENENTTLPEPITEHFNDLDKMLDKFCASPSELETCREALAELKRIYVSVAHFDSKSILQTGHVFTWMTSVSADFVMLIQNHAPAALILIAHFASVSLAVRSAWYTRNWGNYCLAGVSLALEGTEYQPWLDWPKAHAHSNMAILTPGKTEDGSPSF